MNKLVALSFFIIFTSLPRMYSSRKVLMLKGNMFQKLNGLIQTMFNGIFTTLKLNKNFTLEYKHRLLLSMHASMKSIAEDNYGVYKTVKRICKFNDTKRPKEGLFNLDKLIEVVVEDRLNPDMNNSKNSTETTGLKLKITSLEIPNKSEESIVFLREYLNNVENMQLVGFETPSQKIKEIYEKNAKIRVIKRKNLKTWQAPHGPELVKLHNRRLFKGLNTKIKRFPFVVSIHVMGDFVCTGSVISAEMVITAGTCLQVMISNPKFLVIHPKSIVVRVGSEFTDRNGELCYVSKIYFHPSFDPVTLRNNLAIVKIKKRLNFRQNHKLRRIEYLKKGEKMLMGSVKDIMLLGWGEKEDLGPNPLSYSNLKIYSTEKCMTTYSKKYVTDTNYCAGFSSKGSGACQRDVGGPAIVNSTLVGVVSFGPPICGTPNAPTVFSNISLYTAWIDSVIKGIPSKVKPKHPSKLLARLKTTIVKQLRKLTPQLQMKMRSNDKKHFKYRAAEESQVLQVISFLLNKVLGGNLRLGSDDDEMGKSDSSSDEKKKADNIKVVTEISEEPKTEETAKPKNNYRNRNNPDDTPANDPEPLYNDRHIKITTPLPDTYDTDVPEINRQGLENTPTGNENIQFQNYSGLTEGLVISALRVLQEYLGLNVSVTPLEESIDNSAVMIDSSADQIGRSNKKYLSNMMSSEEPKMEHVEPYKQSENEGNNNEKSKDTSASAEGISIELLPNTTVSPSSYPLLTFSRRPTTESDKELMAEIVKEGGDLMSEEEENKFLSNNFIPDAPPRNIQDENDLVVLLLQDTTTRKHKMKTTRKPVTFNDFGLLSTQFMSEDEERKTVSNSNEEVTQKAKLRKRIRYSKSTYKNSDTDDDDEDNEKNGRRNILDYINIT